MKCRLLIAAALAAVPSIASAQSVQTLKNEPPNGAELTFLLTDGTVLARRGKAREGEDRAETRGFFQALARRGSANRHSSLFTRVLSATIVSAARSSVFSELILASVNPSL